MNAAHVCFFFMKLSVYFKELFISDDTLDIPKYKIEDVTDHV